MDAPTHPPRQLGRNAPRPGKMIRPMASMPHLKRHNAKDIPFASALHRSSEENLHAHVNKHSLQGSSTLVNSLEYDAAHNQQILRDLTKGRLQSDITATTARQATHGNKKKSHLRVDVLNWVKEKAPLLTKRPSTSSFGSLDPTITCIGVPSMMKGYIEPVVIKPAPAPSPSVIPSLTSFPKRAKYSLFPKIAKYPSDKNHPGVDANDESLQRYKQSLGLGGGKDLSDPNDPRVCIIHSLTMDSPGRDPVTIDLSAPGSEQTLKDRPFKIKEGCKFTMVASFKVQHEILSGLQYVQVVKRKGIKVSKDSEMLGSYAPNTDKQPLYSKRFQEEEAPSGMLARGHYNATSSFVDDDKKTHLLFEWSFDIAKDW
ncbi:immunoglobulin E-set [Jackrogersella minutella]|nr:immunoglobulin E-set [Jackrogersella minutella]